ncbi:MAG: PepSY-associated TM helix domain-containing protein [Steroidobacteraceae bacterium]
MLRKILFNIHWLIGITIGIPLALMGVTGAMMSFEDEMISLLNGRPTHVTPTGQPLAVSELVERIKLAAPTDNIASVTLPADAERAAEVRLIRPSVEGAAGQQIISLVNPYTGELLKPGTDRGERFMKAVQHLHRRLVPYADVGPPVKVVIECAGCASTNRRRALRIV